MQKDRFTNGRMNDACKEMCSWMDDHAKMCSRTDGWENMQDVLTDGWTDEHAPFVNKWTCQAFQHTSKEKHANATSSEPNDHWRLRACFHAEVKLWHTMRTSITSNTVAWHAHQQKHEYTITLMSSHIMSHVIHISIVGHIVNQWNVTWKSKRPTCCMKSHVK